MEHPAFADAGAEPGVEIWTIEKFEPVAVASKYYGKFYNGDSYIVLKTTSDNNSSLNYDAHFWLGAQTTQDKKGSAAIWTITLDDMLGGRAVHHREVQGYESSKFLGYFKPAIRYMEGGTESGFNEVTTNAGAEKRLLKLTGCDNMRITEVPAEATSLTKNHCFILEVEHDIFVLMPDSAKATQRRKIISVANKLRDEEHNGRATIEIIDEFSPDEDVAAFFEALGSGSKDDIAEESDVEMFSRDSTAVFLYKVLVGEDCEFEALDKPFKQKHLSSDELYILDSPTSGVYIWLGKGVDADVKKNYNDVVESYMSSKGYPSWIHVTRVSEGSESSSFKQYFQNWDTSGSTSVKTFLSDIDAGYYSGDSEAAASSAKLIGKSAAARGYMPDAGDGELVVYRVEDGELVDISEKFQSGLSVLYQGDAYVIQYKYAAASGDDAYVLYWWIGAKADADDKKVASAEVSRLEEELEGDTTVIKVPQGKEPKHFLAVFKGHLIVLLGSKGDEYKTDNSKGSYEEDGVRLFKVEGTEPGVDMRAVQVPESADSLEDDDVYVLETSGNVYIWHGKESDEKEQEAAREFLSMVVSDEREVVTVEQGSEPDEFWDALGGNVDEKEDNSGWRNAVNRRVNADTTLTAVTVKLTGAVILENMANAYTQEDLSDDSVYILDTGEEIYFWRGKNVPERVKAAKSTIIETYLEKDGLDRNVDSAVVVTVKQGKEPKVFQKLFPSWDSDMWENQASYEDIKNETKAANTK